jgi:hypothetical protein
MSVDQQEMDDSDLILTREIQAQLQDMPRQHTRR